METQIAHQVSIELTDILGRLDSSIRLVMENCSDEDFQIYRAGVGRVMGILVLDVMNPLYDRNPEVKPAGYD